MTCRELPVQWTLHKLLTYNPNDDDLLLNSTYSTSPYLHGCISEISSVQLQNPRASSCAAPTCRQKAILHHARGAKVISSTPVETVLGIVRCRDEISVTMLRVTNLSVALWCRQTSSTISAAANVHGQVDCKRLRPSCRCRVGHRLTWPGRHTWVRGPSYPHQGATHQKFGPYSSKILSLFLAVCAPLSDLFCVQLLRRVLNLMTYLTNNYCRRPVPLSMTTTIGTKQGHAGCLQAMVH